MEFKDWHDIQNWCREHGFEKLAKRMQVNNDCWMSCGEFGRDQVYICDNLRFCEVDDREAVAQALQDGDDLIELGVI